MSAAPVCTATLATGFNTTVDYSGSTTNLTASVQYFMMSNTEINCGDFTFTATEDGLTGSSLSPLSGISFFDSTRPPTAVAIVVGNPQVLPGEMVEIIVTATKADDYGDQQVRFPQVVESSSPVCTATLTSASTPTQNYASNQAGTMANVRYTVTSPTAILCGDFIFKATEDGLVGSATPLSGIALFDLSITSPILEREIIYDANDPSSAQVNLRVIRRSHIVPGALPSPKVTIKTSQRISSCEFFQREVEDTYSGSPGIVSYSYNLTFIQNPLAGGSCLADVTVEESNQEQVVSRFTVRFLPVAGQVDFSTDLDAANTVVNPATEDIDETITVTATATKGDGISEFGRRGVIFRSILTNSNPTSACVVGSPTASIPSGGGSRIVSFPDFTLGSQTNFTYEFGVATSFQNTEVTCEWALSATAEHSPDANASTTSVYLKFVPSGNQPPSFVIEQGNATRFPDEGPVQYTLNITSGDSSDDPQLDIMATTTDTCSIIPPAQPPAYQNRVATTTYSVVYAGAVNAKGDLPGGTCVVDFVVSEDREVAPTQQRSIVFKDQLAPNVAAQAIGEVSSLPRNQVVVINVIATKRDLRNTQDVTFLGRIISSGGCTATLDGNELRQYNGILAGSSSVAVTYMVTSSSTGGACGNLVFTATENTATATHILSSGIIFNLADPNDIDGDGVSAADDIDEDGDGLIEIATAAEFNQLRDDLAGSSFSGNSLGCGGDFYANGSRIQECLGYELVADIDLAAAGYSNWDPIGRNSAFTGIFEGNKHVIDNLNMQLYSGHNWGLFGSIKGATLSNVHVRNVNITFSGDNSGVVDTDINPVPARVGGLVGYAQSGSWIINSSVTGHLVAGALDVGGLVGNAEGVGIISSYVELEELNVTTSRVGGLVGQAQDVTMRLSYALTGKITIVGTNGGGLFGRAYISRIESSMAITTNFTAQNIVGPLIGSSSYGGLFGEGRSVAVSFTAGITGNMLEDVTISGGLFGFSHQFGNFNSRTTIDASYAITQFQTVRQGNNLYGGLIGNQGFTATVGNSYWDSTVLSPADTRNRFVSAYGQGKTTTNLQGTTDFSGSNNIYSAWANGWCDAATNEFTTDPSHPLATIPNADANRFWDLGTATEYPAMNCLPNFTPAEQRAAMARVLNGELPLRNQQ